jgi:diguanylate cyclase (GGDEF)-like protein
MLDLDHFKAMNDQHGHLAGDHVLVAIVSEVSSAVRGTDVVGRWGGEEFLVVLPQTDERGALELAERLRRRIASVEVFSEGVALRVTASLGVAQAQREDSIDSITERADDALYQAKLNGRNRSIPARTQRTPESRRVARLV